MRHIKSERLKKLELELNDLEQWLKLGLVPKKDIEKHREEIKTVQSKIEEEKERLQFLKESGDGDEYIAPKRQNKAHAGFADMPTIPDIDVAETQGGLTESGFDMESEYEGSESTAHDHDDDEEEHSESGEEKEDEKEEEEDESFFSDKNRWRRGGIIDPDADEW
jgi:hypothetical protein